MTTAATGNGVIQWGIVGAVRLWIVADCCRGLLVVTGVAAAKSEFWSPILPKSRFSGSRARYYLR